nr:LruC domain-containing protein [Bacteroidota bacterium]
MKIRKINQAVLFSLAIVFALASCKKDSPDDPGNTTETKKMNEMVVPDDFLFNTSTVVTFEINAKTNDDTPLPNVPVKIYTKSVEDGGSLLTTGMTDQNGVFSTIHPLPNYLTEVLVATTYVGLPDEIVAPVSNGRVEATLGGKPNTSFKSGIFPVPFKSTDYLLTPMGTYNNLGVPDYLVVPDDIVDPGLLSIINSSLPESVNLTTSHPAWILPSINYDLEILIEGEVWITFIDEGAGYKNVFGYYTYDIATPPATVDDIAEINIIFPNMSLDGAGGGLVPGNKVYLGLFPANTGIGFVLLANGWKQLNPPLITMGNFQVYSNPDFNPQLDPNVRQQMVGLYDAVREIIIYGVEDILRPNGDKDFNDAVFYITANPPEAIDPINFPSPDPIDDNDGDGVPNDVDEYPEDPDRAFNVHYPSEGVFGTLAYEDLWPAKGDYDFNDMVMNYHVKHVTNALNHVVDIYGTYKLRALGASYRNGFGFQMGADEADFSTVEITYMDNTTVALPFEPGQSDPTLILFANGFDYLKHQGGGTIGVNTMDNVPPIDDYTFEIYMTTNNPINLVYLGTPPYNPFIYINQNRGKEVHFRDYLPTDLVNPAYFGTYEDVSDVPTGVYYKTANNLPWGIHLIESFDYPIEKAEITEAYLHFVEWAESGGAVYPDW